MGYKRRRKTDIPSSSGNIAQMMNLSLFIMLLAFFIVLNAISSYKEEKSDQVIRSLELAFSADPRVDDQHPSVRPAPEKSEHTGHVFDRLESLFEAEISSYRVKINKSSGVMTMEVPLDYFVRVMAAIGQEDLAKMPTRRTARGNIFLPTLVSLLQTENNGVPTRMEIIMHVKRNPAQVQNQNPQKLSSVMKRLSGFTKRLEALGFPQKLFNIGVRKGDVDFVTLVFRRYEPLSFVKEEGAGR